MRDQLQLGEMDSALTFQIKCLPNVTEADLQDFCDFVTVMVKTSGILDEVDAPFSAITRMAQLIHLFKPFLSMFSLKSIIWPRIYLWWNGL